MNLDSSNSFPLRSNIFHFDLQLYFPLANGGTSKRRFWCHSDSRFVRCGPRGLSGPNKGSGFASISRDGDGLVAGGDKGILRSSSWESCRRPKISGLGWLECQYPYVGTCAMKWDKRVGYLSPMAAIAKSTCIYSQRISRDSRHQPETNKILEEPALN